MAKAPANSTEEKVPSEPVKTAEPTPSAQTFAPPQQTAKQQIAQSGAPRVSSVAVGSLTRPPAPTLVHRVPDRASHKYAKKQYLSMKILGH